MEVGTEGESRVGVAVNDERRFHAVTPDFYAMPTSVVNVGPDVDLDVPIATVHYVENDSNAAGRVHHLGVQ